MITIIVLRYSPDGSTTYYKIVCKSFITIFYAQFVISSLRHSMPYFQLRFTHLLLLLLFDGAKPHYRRKQRRNLSSPEEQAPTTVYKDYVICVQESFVMLNVRMDTISKDNLVPPIAKFHLCD